MRCPQRFSCAKQTRHGDVFTFVCGALVLMGVLFLLFLIPAGIYNRVMIARKEAREQRQNQVASEILGTQNDSSRTSPVVTNEKLWNRLTEARINLESDNTESPAGDTSGESEATSESENDPRPDWIDKPPKRVGNVYRTVVRSDPFSSEDECYAQLEKRFLPEVTKQLRRIVPYDQQALVDTNSLAGVGISLSTIMKDICRESYTETLDSSVGEMKKVHVLMEFTPAVEKHLQQEWNSYQRRFRLGNVAGLAAIVLFAVAIAYGLLQLDTWSRGYYTKRLLFGVPAVIIAIVAVLRLF